MQAEATQFFAGLEEPRSEESLKADTKQKEASLTAEKNELLAELEVQEKECLKKHANDKDFISKDPADKFPCVQAEATNFFSALEKQEEEKEKLEQEAEAAQIVKDLEVQEQACLKKHANDPSWKNSEDPTDKFPCMQAEATSFFSKLETEGEACVNYGTEGKQECFKGPGVPKNNEAQASKKAEHDADNIDGVKPEGLKAKAPKYGNPFDLPKS